jgi:hypothetical protein
MDKRQEAVVPRWDWKWQGKEKKLEANTIKRWNSNQRCLPKEIKEKCKHRTVNTAKYTYTNRISKQISIGYRWCIKWRTWRSWPWTRSWPRKRTRPWSRWRSHLYRRIQRVRYLFTGPLRRPAWPSQLRQRWWLCHVRRRCAQQSRGR